MEEKPHCTFTEFSVVIIICSISRCLFFALLSVCWVIREGIHDFLLTTHTGFELQMCVYVCVCVATLFFQVILK
jgi:hypothetical protein